MDKYDKYGVVEAGKKKSFVCFYEPTCSVSNGGSVTLMMQVSAGRNELIVHTEPGDVWCTLVL